MAFHVNDAVGNLNQAGSVFQRSASLGDVPAAAAGWAKPGAFYDDRSDTPELHLTAFCNYLAESMRLPACKADASVLSQVSPKDSVNHCPRLSNPDVLASLPSAISSDTTNTTTNTNTNANTNLATHAHASESTRRGPSGLDARFSEYSAPESLEFDATQPAVLTAADFGDADALPLIASSRETLAKCDRQGLTPAMLAARSGVAQTVRILFDMGADFSARTPERGDTVMHIAAESGSPEVLALVQRLTVMNALAFLGDMGLSVDVTNKLGETPLHTACASDRGDNVSALLALGADPLKTTRAGDQFAHVAAKNGGAAALRALVDTCAEASDYTRQAALKEELEVCNGQGETPLHLAAARGNVEVVKALLEYGVAPDCFNGENESVVFVAASAGEHDVLRLLAGKGADLSMGQTEGLCVTPAQVAAYLGYTETLRVLAQLGAPLEKCDAGGASLAHYACRGDDPAQYGKTLEVVQALGLSLSAKDDAGNTPLHQAVQKENVPAIRALLSAGADVSVRSAAGYTALDYAAVADNAEAAEILCRAGATLNLALPKGFTTAHIAARVGSIGVLSVMQRYNLNLAQTNAAGLSPAQLAARDKHPLLSAWVSRLGEGLNLNEGLVTGVVAGAGDAQAPRQANVQVGKPASDPRAALIDQAGEMPAVLGTEARDIRARSRAWFNNLNLNDVSSQAYFEAGELCKRLEAYTDEGSEEFDVDDEHASVPAARFGDAAALRLLHALGEPLAKEDAQGKPLLLLAIRSGVADAVRAVLELMDQRAVRESDADVARDEIEPAGVAMDNERRDTPLHMAAMYGQPDMLAVLASRQPSLDVPNALGAAPLHLACAKDRPDNVTRLLALGADPGSATAQGAQALHIAADAGALSALQAFVNALAEMGVEAARLVDAPIPSSGETPLHKASEAGHSEVVAALLAYGADPNREDSDRERPAFMAAQRGHSAVIRQLAAQGADLSSGRSTLRRETPAHAAAYGGHSETLRTLAALGVALDQPDAGGRTPAHYAACSNPIEATTTIKVLHDLGVNIEVPDGEGLTPLHLAVALENLPAIETLLDLGVKAEPKSTDGYTPLDYAALYNKPKAAELLCRRGARVNTRLPQGGTTVHVAAAAGSTDVIKTFQRHRMSFEYKNTDGLTPADVAERCDRPLTAHWIRQLSQSPTGSDAHLSQAAAAPSG